MIPLINIVFLLLIFFLLAGRIADPPDPDIAPPASAETPDAPAEAASLAVTAEGGIRYLGAPAALADAARSIAAAGLETPSIIRADRNAPAARVLEAAAALKAAGMEETRLVVEVAE